MPENTGARTATDLGTRAQPLDLRGGGEEVHSIVVVLRQAGPNGQDIGVKNDILKQDLFHRKILKDCA
eukprot:1147521-Pelagomonas_calceolata.AAC.3